MIFQYQARDKNKKIVSGFVEAVNEKAAADSLKEKDYFIISMEPGQLSSKGLSSIELFGRVKKRDVVIFSRQLAVMAQATLPIAKALKILVDQTENPKLKTIVSEVASDIESGMSLSVSLSKHPKVFSDFYVSMIKSGEVSGKIGEVLNYLADQEERNYDLMNKIKGAMTYPIFIIGGVILVGTAMMIFVIPKLTAILEEASAELPLTTRALIAVSDFMAGYWWVLLALILVLIFSVRLALKTPAGRQTWDLLKLKLPIFGNLFQKIYLVRFTRSLSTLIIGGVTLTEAFKIVREVIGNKVYQDLIDKTIREVEDGNSITTVFSQSRNVPTMLSQMMGVGEQTGRLNDILERLGDFYAREVETLVANLTTLMEPLIMVIMGLGVGVLVAAIMMPMYNLASQF